MSLREAAEALLDDYDSIELEEGSYKVAWPEMEALRAALAEADLVRRAVCCYPHCLNAVEAPKAESAGAEPVELSAEEIINLWKGENVGFMQLLEFARAVLAAARGKG